MKDTQSPGAISLEKLSPEIYQLRNELSDLVDRFSELSAKLPAGHSFCLLTAFSFCTAEDDKFLNNSSRTSGGDQFFLCLLSAVKTLREKNTTFFEIV